MQAALPASHCCRVKPKSEQTNLLHSKPQKHAPTAVSDNPSWCAAPLYVSAASGTVDLWKAGGNG